MNRYVRTLAVFVVALGSVPVAQAASILLSQDDFDHQTRGLVSYSETFDDFTSGFGGGVLELEGIKGTIEAAEYFLGESSWPACDGVCFAAAVSPFDVVTFAGLDTAYFGFDITLVASGLQVDLDGGSGFSTFRIPVADPVSTTFLGFFDPLGIEKVTLTTISGSSMSGDDGPSGIDNLRSARQVHEPGTMTLFAIGLAGIGLTRHRRAQKSIH